MAARQKLNAAFFNGAIVLAALIGWWTQSWVVFLVAAAILIGVGIHSTEIRLTGHGRQGGGRR